MIVITDITMFFGGGLIPWFLLMKDIGLYNSLWAMILPTALSTWNMIILRTGFQAIPLELLMKEILVVNDSTATTMGSAGGVVMNSAGSSTAYRELVKYCTIVVRRYRFCWSILSYKSIL